MAMTARLWKLVPTAAIGAAAFTLTTQTAQAFFPPLPLGSDTVTVSPPPPVLVPPTIPFPPPAIPPAPPPVFVPPASPPPIVVPQDKPPTCTCPPRPQTVPEPTTILSSAIGLGVVGGIARWRRKRKEQA